MLTNKTRVRPIILASLGFLGLGLSIFIALTAFINPASEPPEFENRTDKYQSPSAMGSVGEEYTDNLFSTFLDGDTIYVVWKGSEGDTNVYYSYYPARGSDGNWTASGWSKSAKIGNFTSTSGVEAVIYTPDPTSTEKREVCLFLGRDVAGNQEQQFKYICTSQFTSSQNGQAPTFTWATMHDIGLVPSSPDDEPVPKEGNVSIKMMPEQSCDNDPGIKVGCFYLVRSQRFETCAIWEPDCKHDNYIQLNRVEKTASTSGQLKFTEIHNRVSSLSNSTLYLYPTPSDLEYFIFYYDLADKKVGYGSIIQGEPLAQMVDGGSHTRGTENRPFNYEFKDNIYVGFKDASANEKLRFAKILKTDWDGISGTGVHGQYKWTFCDFYRHEGNNTFDAAMSKVPPVFFEYQDRLYFLFADGFGKPGNRLTYFRIDNIDMHATTGNFTCSK